MVLKYFSHLLETNKKDVYVDSNIIVSGYNLFVKNSTGANDNDENVIEIQIVQKRGLYKCEDDIFCFKKVNECQYEFWDYMNYIETIIDTEENIIFKFFQVINKISLMYKALQRYHLNKPKLVDSPELLFTIKSSRKCPIKYSHETDKIILGFYKKYNCEHL